MDLGIFEALGFVMTLVMIGIIVWFIMKGIPHDAAADFRGAGGWFEKK